MTIFDAITWKQYGAMIAIGLVLYYAIIFLRYKKAGIGSLLEKSKKQKHEQDEDFYPDEDEDEQHPAKDQAFVHSFDELEALVTEIRHSILEKAGKAVSKEDLLSQISKRLTNYGGLRQPAYRIALTNFIIEQSENICGVSFSEEELEAAWDKLPR